MVLVCSRAYPKEGSTWPQHSAGELAVRYSEGQGYFVSDSRVYRLLKAHQLISSPAFILMKTE